MTHPQRPRAPRILAFSLAVAALGLGCLGARPALAKEDEDEGPALAAPVYTFHSSAILYVANTGSDAVRALVAVRDPAGKLVGCGDGTLEGGEGDVLYVRAGPAAGGVLSIKVYGLEPEGALERGAEGRGDLAGSVTLVDKASGAPLGVIELLEVAATHEDRRDDIGDCLDTRFGRAGSGQARNVLRSNQPARWGGARTRQGADGLAPISSASSKQNASSGKVEDDDKRDSKDKEKAKDKDKDDDKDDDEDEDDEDDEKDDDGKKDKDKDKDKEDDD